MRQQSVGSALSSADPMQVTAKIVSLIDTVRYINWPRRLVLIYIYSWAGSLELSGVCDCGVSSRDGRYSSMEREPANTRWIRATVSCISRNKGTPDASPSPSAVP
jgi:hypothetical protein